MRNVALFSLLVTGGLAGSPCRPGLGANCSDAIQAVMRLAMEAPHA